MKRLIAGVCVALATTLSGATGAEFRMTTTFAEGSLSWQLHPEKIANKVALATDGEVVIKPYPPGVLAGVFEGFKAVLDGRADMAHHYPAFEANENPAAAFIGTVPGGMGSYAMLLWIREGGGAELWKEYRESQGLHGLFCGLIGSELFANSHKPVKSLADLQGLRYRTAGAAAWVMENIGASPAVIPGPDTFPLLERKGIDAAEYLDPVSNYQLGFHKIAKYVIYPGIHAPGSAFELLMKKETWDSLPEETQQKIEMACDSVILTSYAHLQYENAMAMKAMDENEFNQLIRLDDEVIEAVRVAGREWAAEKMAEEEANGTDWVRRFADSYFGFLETWNSYSGFEVRD